MKSNYIKYGLLAALIPEMAWAGSGGPVTYSILALVIVAIIMLGAVLKKIK